MLAEYLVGGMTAARLRLIAARVIACQAMLEGATFEETFRIRHRDFGLDDRGAFNVVLRVFRGGGLGKDAIYLRGMGQILDHLKDGGSLTPFWIGKISAAHFGAIQELNARGLLRGRASNLRSSLPTRRVRASRKRWRGWVRSIWLRPERSFPNAHGVLRQFD